MLIQFILIIVIALIVLRLVIKLRNKEINISGFLFWLIIWLTAVLVIWQPELTSFVANRVGVTRGVDLVIYVSVVLIFYLLFRLLMRLEKIEKNITKIIREIALKDDEK